MGEGGGGPVLLSPFLASIFPLFAQKRLILRLSWELQSTREKLKMMLMQEFWR